MSYNTRHSDMIVRKTNFLLSLKKRNLLSSNKVTGIEATTF